MNVILMQNGFPLTIILKNDRKKYYRVLAQADKNNFKPQALFIAQAVERTLDIYLKTLTPMTGKREQFLPLSKLAEDTPYSAKYLNLLIRQSSEQHREIHLPAKETRVTVTCVSLKGGPVKFYARTQELKLLQQLKEQTADSARMTVLTGRRRVGKTKLALEFAHDHKYLYFFIAKKSEQLLCEEFLSKHFLFLP